jgi:DNA-binding PadR family transcriptional regulator
VKAPIASAGSGIGDPEQASVQRSVPSDLISDSTGQPSEAPAPLLPPLGAQSESGRPTDPTPSGKELVSISERVLVRLLQLPAPGPYAAASLERTQAGMCATLAIRQGSLTRALVRMEASGALAAKRAHVEGMGQRLKVYELTPLGEAVARSLWSRRAARVGGVSGPAAGSPPQLGASVRQLGPDRGSSDRARRPPSYIQ